MYCSAHESSAGLSVGLSARDVAVVGSGSGLFTVSAGALALMIVLDFRVGFREACPAFTVK